MIVASLRNIFVMTLLIMLVSFDQPKGWVTGGNKPDNYESGIVKGEGRNGGNYASIKSLANKVKGFCTLRQSIFASGYSGKKIMLSVYMKSQQVSIHKWAGFWLSIDDKMYSATMKEDTKDKTTRSWSSDWKKYEIVAEVPHKANYINFGGQLAGPGQLWFDDIQIEVVGELTEPEDKNNLHVKKDGQQINLNFEE